jgi:butyryl-CoA dehydrogenase
MQLTESQVLARDTAREFARRRLAPHSRTWENEAAFPGDVLAELGSLGFLGMTVPEELGGAGLDYVSYALALMEIAAGDGALSTLMSVNNAPVCAILAGCGSERQKDAYLRPLAAGQTIGAFALTEPHAGSDAASLRMSAKRVEGGYVLNGTKQFITSGSIAGLTITFAVTDAAAGKRGLSAFLVPTGSTGFRVGRLESKLGQRASDTAQLVYENVFVDDWLRIGDEGDGYRIALANLETGRIGIAAQSVGMAAAALEHALAYARDRRAFGRPLTEHQAVAFRLADMATEVEAARQLVLHAASLKDAGALPQGSVHGKTVCIGTRRVGRFLRLGGYGYAEDYLVEKIYRDVRVCQIYEGTSDIQRLLIGRELAK